MPSSLFELTSSTAVMNRQLREARLVAAADEATTLTAAQCIESIVTMTPTAGRNLTTASAAAILTELGGTQEVGSTFTLRVVNLASSTHAITLQNGSNVTITGSATISAATSATFLGYIASTTAITFYRV